MWKLLEKAAKWGTRAVLVKKAYDWYKQWNANRKNKNYTSSD